MGHIVSCINPHRPDSRGVDNAPARHRMHAAELKKRIARRLFNRQDSNDLRATTTDKDMTPGSESVSWRANAAFQTSSEQGRATAIDSAEDPLEAANKSKIINRKIYEIDGQDRSLWEVAHEADAQLQRLLDLEMQVEEGVELDDGVVDGLDGHSDAEAVAKEEEVAGGAVKRDDLGNVLDKTSHEGTLKTSVIGHSYDEDALGVQKKAEAHEAVWTDRLLSVREGIALFDAKNGSAAKLPSDGIHVRKLEAMSGHHEFKHSDHIET